MAKPRVVIPIGDPAGIGPEIALKAVCDSTVRQAADCVLVGSRDVLEDAARFSGCPADFRLIQSPADYEDNGCVHLVSLDNVEMNRLKMGQVSAMCGRAAYEYIEKSVAFAMNGEADAVCTTAINKESLKAGQVPYIGHTEIFAALTGTADPLTMFEVHGMRIFFLTRHVSLRQACDLVTKDRIVDYVLRCQEALRSLGAEDGVMAVAGLNPHSGEHGLFGDEEVREVIPAVEELQARGVRVEGPIGADSVFHQALQGKYSAVLSLYHDQGHIAAKTLDFERTVSVTCGMPVLRTSVDHGTAFDIAGKGIASAVSMKEAIFVAAKYAATCR